MTRLRSGDVAAIPAALPRLETRLRAATGEDYLGLAAGAAGKTRQAVMDRLHSLAAVVPMSSGQGIIEGFAGAVTAVLQHMGFRASRTRADVAGFGQAMQRGADLVFAADDHTFLAFDMRRRSVVDNAPATALGFVEALSRAAQMRGRSLHGSRVLLIGLGRVGTWAGRLLEQRGARLWVHDRDLGRVRRFVGRGHGRQAAEGIEAALQAVDFVFDASPARELIHASHVRPETLIAAPGVPHGLTAAAVEAIGDRWIHDILPLGVAVMAVLACFPGAPLRRGRNSAMQQPKPGDWFCPP